MTTFYRLLISSSKLSHGFLRKSGHAHYIMFFFQKIRRWLLVALCFGCGLQCTLQAAHLIISVFFPLSVLKIDKTDMNV